MIRKHKKYVRPKQIFETERIKEENQLKERFGLRNKTEIWKTQAKVDYFRQRAKALARSPLEEQELFFSKLRAIGLKVENSADVLDLKVENLLARRLPTIVASKKLAHSPLHARQLVTHKLVLIDGKAMSAPSYLVPVSQENKITIKQKTRKPKPKPTPEAEAQSPTTDAPTEQARESQEKPTEAPSKEADAPDTTKTQSSDKNVGQEKKNDK
jgi:small subunit ribosomal protein S4